MPPRIDLRNKKFGMLTVLDMPDERQPDGRLKVWCLCECGRKNLVCKKSLKNGNSYSCGCYRRRNLEIINKKHGYAVRGRFMTEYNSWTAMKQRCYYEKSNNYHNYGGRGITVCDRWINSFDNFISDMGLKPSNSYSLDRIDNNGNYEPGNCRWATKQQQMSGRSTSHVIEYNGIKDTIQHWAKKFGINRSTLLARLNMGWSVEESLLRKVGKSGNRRNVWKHITDKKDHNSYCLMYH